MNATLTKQRRLIDWWLVFWVLFIRLWVRLQLAIKLTSRLGSCSSAMSRRPAFFLPFCRLALFSSTSADVGSMIDRAVSSSQDKTHENISRLCTLHDSHFWLWRWGRQANTAVICKRDQDLISVYERVLLCYLCDDTQPRKWGREGERKEGRQARTHAHTQGGREEKKETLLSLEALTFLRISRSVLLLWQPYLVKVSPSKVNFSQLLVG